jgi:hypothetical protein
LITCEYTGGLEQPLLIACTDANLPIAVINPKQAKDFARAILDPTPAPSGFLIPQRHLSGLDRLGRWASTPRPTQLML